jgi:DNA-binding CsgD family transcriptional regulator
LIEPDLVDDIYEAAAIPEFWPGVIDRISKLMKSVGGVLFSVTPTYSGWTSSRDYVPLFTDFIAAGWHQKNVRAERALAQSYPGFIGDHELLTREEMDRSPMYAWLRNKGFGWCAGTVIKVPSGDTVIFSWERALEDGPVDSGTLRELDPLRAHLARAALISGRLALERARAAAEALGLIGLPAAVLSRSHRMLVANKLLSPLIPDVLQDRRERLVLSDAGADGLLKQAFTRLRAGDGASKIYSIPLKARKAHPASIIHVVPVRGAARDIFSAASCILVVTPVTHSGVPAADLIQGLFDLTPAEARIAQKIAEGQTLADAAAGAGISAGTARKQLKCVFAKTGVTRQAELVGLLRGTDLAGG